MANEEFAQPWLEFEKQLGYRLLLHGPEVQDCIDGFTKVGGDLMSKFTFPPPDTSCHTEDRTTAHGVKVRIFTPPNYTGGKPICVDMHGGGWAMGDLDSHAGECVRIAKGAGVVVVSVEYRLAPTYKWPAQLDDCYAAYIWTLENTESLGGAEGKVFLEGVSAGGHLAISTALKVIDEGKGDTLLGVVAQMPVTIHPDVVPESLKSKYTAFEENAEKTVDTASAMRTFWKALGADPSDKYASPLLHDRVKALKKVYTTAASVDTLRDDARLFRDELNKHSVPNGYDEYEGYPHYFWTFPGDMLKRVQAEYTNKLIEGVKFVISP